MEDGLGAILDMAKLEIAVVLILVLVEDGLGGNEEYMVLLRQVSLNPCFGGRWSRSGRPATDREIEESLNPCFGGRWSRSMVLKVIVVLGIGKS